MSDSRETGNNGVVDGLCRTNVAANQRVELTARTAGASLWQSCGQLTGDVTPSGRPIYSYVRDAPRKTTSFPTRHRTAYEERRPNLQRLSGVLSVDTYTLIRSRREHREPVSTERATRRIRPREHG